MPTNHNSASLSLPCVLLVTAANPKHDNKEVFPTFKEKPRTCLQALLAL
jgi:hypothetical protein